MPYINHSHPVPGCSGHSRYHICSNISRCSSRDTLPSYSQAFIEWANSCVEVQWCGRIARSVFTHEAIIHISWQGCAKVKLALVNKTATGNSIFITVPSNFTARFAVAGPRQLLETAYRWRQEKKIWNNCNYESQTNQTKTNMSSL